MTKDNFENRVQRLIEMLMIEREEFLIKGITQIKQGQNYRGMFFSSATWNRIRDYCVNELKIRASIIWQGMVRIHKVTNISKKNNLSDEFKHIFKRILSSERDKLENILLKAIPKMGGVQDTQLKQKLYDTENLLGRKYEMEIEIYADCLKHDCSKKEHASSPVLNINGDIGVIQTGTYATANIVQNLTGENREELLQALKNIRQELPNATELSENEKYEMEELINDSCNELEKEKPNSEKIKAFVRGIGGKIETVTKLYGFYEALKGAASLVGIVL